MCSETVEVDNLNLVVSLGYLAYLDTRSHLPLWHFLDHRIMFLDYSITGLDDRFSEGGNVRYISTGDGFGGQAFTCL